MPVTPCGMCGGTGRLFPERRTGHEPGCGRRHEAHHVKCVYCDGTGKANK